MSRLKTFPSVTISVDDFVDGQLVGSLVVNRQVSETSMFVLD